MPPSFELVVCITSTALFDCSESHEIWKRNGVEAYKVHQRSRTTNPLQPGVGFSLVKSLLALNEVAGKNLVEVVLVSRNNSEAAERVRYSINHHKLRITRMSFTCGTDVTYYLTAWKCDLFLSTDEEQVRRVLSGSKAFDGIAAGLVCNIMPELALSSSNIISTENNNSVPYMDSVSFSPSQWPEGQVRIAFDGDGVLFSDEAERIAKAQGLEAFYKFEQEREHIALPKGPVQSFALKLQKVRQALGADNQWRVRTFLVTARNDVANLRALHTLKEWSLDIDEAHFLGGLDKTPFLCAIDPAIFFDDSSDNIERAKQYIRSAHVIGGINNTRSTVSNAVSTTESPLENKTEEQNTAEDNINQQ